MSVKQCVCVRVFVCVTEAIDTLKDHVKKNPEGLQKTGFSDGYMLEPRCVKLVSACCAKNDVSEAMELISLLFDCGYVKLGTFVVLENLVEGYLKK